MRVNAWFRPRPHVGACFRLGAVSLVSQKGLGVIRALNESTKGDLTFR